MNSPRCGCDLADRPWRTATRHFSCRHPATFFEEEGHSGNGYAWDSVARIAIRDARIDASSIRFDSEAGTFVAQCDGLDPFFALGRVLSALMRDEQALRNAIRAVPEEDWDD